MLNKCMPTDRDMEYSVSWEHILHEVRVNDFIWLV